MTRHEVSADDVPSMSGVSLTSNERSWIEFLRLVSDGRDPAIRLKDVQPIKRLLDRAPQKTRLPQGDP